MLLCPLQGVLTGLAFDAESSKGFTPGVQHVVAGGQLFRSDKEASTQERAAGAAQEFYGAAFEELLEGVAVEERAGHWFAFCDGVFNVGHFQVYPIAGKLTLRT